MWAIPLLLHEIVDNTGSTRTDVSVLKDSTLPQGLVDWA